MVSLAQRAVRVRSARILPPVAWVPQAVERAEPADLGMWVEASIATGLVVAAAIPQPGLMALATVVREHSGPLQDHFMAVAVAVVRITADH